jgi:GNAT superfamily N-acetyltransferase
METKLRDGSPVVVRAIAPEDKEELARALSETSPETRFRRFMAPLGTPSEAMLKYLTEVDFQDHVAIIAAVPTLDLKAERGIGVARFVRLKDEPHVAEAAVTVTDGWQRRGVAVLLLAELAGLARARGIRCFRAYVLKDNEGVRSLLTQANAVLVGEDEDTYTYDVPLPKDDTLSVVTRLVREAAETMSFVLRRLLPARHYEADSEQKPE